MQSSDQDPLRDIAETLAQLLRRQDEFDERLTRLEAGAVKSEPFQAVDSPQPDRARLNRTVTKPQSDPAATATSEIPDRAGESVPPSSGRGIETRLGLTIVNRVGVVTLVLGVAFFFKWATDNNWIGPTTRVFLGIFASFAALGAGDLLWRKRQTVFAQGLTGGGIAVLYLSLYAAFSFYQLIGQAAAFALMLAATGLAIALSLRYTSSAILSLGLFGGYLTPLLLSTGQDHPWFLFSYVLLLDAAAMTLGKRRNWRVPEVLSFIATVLIYGVWLVNVYPSHKDHPAATVALLAFYALYSQAPVSKLFLFAQFLAAVAAAEIWLQHPAAFFALALVLALAGLAYGEGKRRPAMLSVTFGSFWFSYVFWTLGSGETPVSQFFGLTVAFMLFSVWQVWHCAAPLQLLSMQRLYVLAANGAVYYAASYAVLRNEHHAWLGALAISVAASYFGFGAYLYRLRSAAGWDSRPALLSLGVALCFVTLAIPIQFHGLTITVTWSLQAALLTWLGFRFREWRATLGGLLVFCLCVVRLLRWDSWTFPDPHSYYLLWNQRFLAAAIMSVSLLVSARWSSRVMRKVALAEYFSGHYILLWGLSLEVIGWAERSSAARNLLSVETVALSIVFGVYALVLVAAGVGTKTALNRITGLGLLGLVIVKLYVFDVWQLDRVYRISAFVALGVLLIATSFLYSRFRQLIESWWKDDEAGA